MLQRQRWQYDLLPAEVPGKLPAGSTQQSNFNAFSFSHLEVYISSECATHILLKFEVAAHQHSAHSACFLQNGSLHLPNESDGLK